MLGSSEDGQYLHFQTLMGKRECNKQPTGVLGIAVEVIAGIVLQQGESATGNRGVKGFEKPHAVLGRGLKLTFVKIKARLCRCDAHLKRFPERGQYRCIGRCGG